jgi:hypothetical protein
MREGQNIMRVSAPEREMFSLPAIMRDWYAEASEAR